MALFLVWFAGTLELWLNASTIERVIRLSGLVVGGGAVYFAVLFALGVRPHQFKVQTVVKAAAQASNP